MQAMGAKPTGTADEASAARAVRQMFDAIAPRYDLLNHVLSANVDRLWWRRTARRFRDVLARPEAAILDICCGTGDMTMALMRRRPRGARPVLAADFARGMLDRGARKFERHGVTVLEADALHLPLKAESLDLIVTAFGFRNLANYEAVLREFQRVLAEEPDAIEEIYEPFLIQIGFLNRTPRGRVATQLAYEHFGITPTRRQSSLF